MPGLIKIKGPFPPPNPFLYPNGRKTAHHLYQIFDDAGRQLIGGTNGPDLDDTIARAKRFAAEKGLTDPTVEIERPA